MLVMIKKGLIYFTYGNKFQILHKIIHIAHVTTDLISFLRMVAWLTAVLGEEYLIVHDALEGVGVPVCHLAFQLAHTYRSYSVHLQHSVCDLFSLHQGVKY